MRLLVLPIRCLLKSVPQSSVSCRSFFISNLAEAGKKWTKAELQPLIEWAKETESIYGPVINGKKKLAPKKPAKPKVKQSVEKSSQELSSDGTREITNVEISRQTQTSGFVEDKVERIVARTKVAFNQVAFDDRIDYEEVSDPEASISPQAPVKTTTNLGPVGTPLAIEILEDSRSSRKDVSSVTDLLSTQAKQDAVTGSVGFKDSAEFLSASSQNVSTRGFLSTILAFPPFTIAWNAVGGRRCIADAVENSTDMEPALKDAGYPSVSAILKATMPPENKFFLDRWEKEMIEELGEEGFQQYKQELFSNGTNLHMCIQKYLEGQPDVDLKEPNRGHWTSLELVLNDVTDVACTEKPVKHPVLRYKGILDCVANYRGKTFVIDWKTSKKPKPNIRQTFDNPIQLAAYLGAYNSLPTLQREVDSCLLVIGYEDGSPASVHEMSRTDCLRYWQTWQRRLHSYWSEHLGRNLNSSMAGK